MRRYVVYRRFIPSLRLGYFDCIPLVKKTYPEVYLSQLRADRSSFTTHMRKASEGETRGSQRTDGRTQRILRVNSLSLIAVVPCQGVLKVPPVGNSSANQSCAYSVHNEIGPGSRKVRVSRLDHSKS